MKISDYQYILCSAFAKVKDILLDQKILNPGNAKVGFVANAADLFDSEKNENWEIRWVKEDEDALKELGYQLFQIDLKQENRESLLQKFSELDVIFVCGGNTFYLLDCMRKSWFTEIISDYLQKGWIYLSTSAGSCVAAPNIEYEKYAADSALVKLENYQGLNFCNIAINPHFNEADILEDVVPVLNYFLTEKVSFPCVNLSDQQAVVGNIDGMFKIIS